MKFGSKWLKFGFRSGENPQPGRNPLKGGWPKMGLKVADLGNWGSLGAASDGFRAVGVQKVGEIG